MTMHKAESLLDCVENGNNYEKKVVDKDPDIAATDEVCDGFYSWVVMVSAFLIQFFSVGVAFSSGVIVVEVRDTFNLGPTLPSLVTSLYCGLAYGASPLSGMLSNRYGHRRTIVVGCFVSGLSFMLSAFANGVWFLLLSYGIIGGLGASLMYSPSISVVGPYFRRHRPLALGFVTVGAAAGPLAFAPLLRWLITLYSWRGAFIIFSGLMLQCCVFGALLTPIKFLVKSRAAKQKPARTTLTWDDVLNYSMLRKPTFLIQFLNNFLWCLAIAPLWFLLPDFARGSGMTKDQAAILIVIASLGNTIGRMGSSFVMSFLPNMNRLHLHNIPAFVGGLCFVIYSFRDQYGVFSTASFLVGLTYGLIVGSLPVVTLELYGIKKLTSAFSYLMLADGLGFLAGPPFTGWMFEQLGNYKVPFSINGAVYAASGIVMYFVLCTKKFDENLDDKMVVQVDIEMEMTSL